MGSRTFGITANLYTVRSGAELGRGRSRRSDDARRVDGGGRRRVRRRESAARAAQRGLRRQPVLARSRGCSGIRCTSRWRRCPSWRTTRGRASASRRRSSRRSSTELRDATMIDYGRVMALRAPLLSSLHRTFAARERVGVSSRGRAYTQFVAREDPQLTQFATFMAIAEREGPDARQLAGAAARCERRRRSPRCARELAERVDFHRWLQFELDRQLGCVATDATRAGLALGVYQDLAVGSAPSGSDVWANPRSVRARRDGGRAARHVLGRGAELGTAGDRSARAARDQVRLLGAAAPRGLPACGRAATRSRARIVPDVLGADRRAGARGDVHEVVRATTCSASSRSRACVTDRSSSARISAPCRRRCRRCWRSGACSARRSLVFERDFHSGRFRPADQYPRLALATVDTHDLPPMVGWLEQRDIILRSEVGDLTDPEQQRGDARACARATAGR